MTGTYEWNPMPHRVDIKCPRCGQLAEFEFVEICRIARKADIDFFKNSLMFEYRQFQDSCGHYWHGALYFAGIQGEPCRTIQELPTGYQPSDWAHSNYLYRNHGLDIGSVNCSHCQSKTQHDLQWPKEAYFSIAYRNQVLWAFNQESACDLNSYLLSKSRDVSKYRWNSFLLHIPGVFKTHKARETLSKQLLRLLGKPSYDSSRSHPNLTPHKRAKHDEYTHSFSRRQRRS